MGIAIESRKEINVFFLVLFFCFIKLGYIDGVMGLLFC